ncbi:hypothetical protein JCM19233_332 [Vibrio astriarenae]|nr:hypothetical protein JCM19233_332 [Vibrio sp. C7]
MKKIEAKREALDKATDAIEIAQLEADIRALELKKNLLVETQ